MVQKWFSLPHISKWINGDGLKSTLGGISRCIKGEEKPNRYWISSECTSDFALLIAGKVDQKEFLFKSVNFDGDLAVSLDIFIGNEAYIGRGLGAYLICDFLLSQFQEATDFVIDPEKSNERAIHVYKKVGFKVRSEFIAPWHPVPHLMMHVSKKDILDFSIK